MLGTRGFRHSPGSRIALVSSNATLLRDRVVSESTLSESTILACPRKLLCPRSDRPWAVGHTLWSSSLRPYESEDDFSSYPVLASLVSRVGGWAAPALEVVQYLGDTGGSETASYPFGPTPAKEIRLIS
ncbi:hypothetical protein MPTK1_6g19080 [Marchantia polymorpha subsp. ruderalis]|uniref:Uncharacterized protein n=2 Tax=Marchantia polymorpha TaxID=3197 RepID=A0AAF6BTN9_MARPO|nr:hypothetical protein MARPO_0045s0155 [Marchantia polymorpha]BBN15373.1 hypothetical protein Mp_6g19080 [Marchantia polymorpha subsp. ruderalis]|eukprot:PTQ39515.1 hypothetical protein MARPO_0045s0155 [Marchantia polymorpha]